MKVLNILIFVFLFVFQVYSFPSDADIKTGITTEKIEKAVNVSVSPLPYSTISPEDEVSEQPTPPSTSSTTETPTTKASTTTSSIPTLSPNSTTTDKPTTPSPVTSTLQPTTSTPNSNTTTQGPSSTTQAPITSTAAPHSHTQRFDFPSFIGGIMLTLGLLAIAFVSHKFYKARTDRNYHTL